MSEYDAIFALRLDGNKSMPLILPIKLIHQKIASALHTNTHKTVAGNCMNAC